MMLLGLELATGKNIQKDYERGERLLREAIAEGEVQAKRILGNLLIENEENQNSIIEGVNLIKASALEGDEKGMLKLAQILFEGTLLPKDEKEGKRLLKKLVQLENAQGIYELAERYLYGQGVDKNIDEGVTLLRRAFEKGDGSAGSLLGRFYYENGHYDLAATYFLKSIELGTSLAKNNYSFMARRREAIEYSGEPTINELLVDAVKEKELFSMINYGLCFAMGFQVEKDWLRADKIFSTLSQCDEEPRGALFWWYEFLINKRNDPEGHLVVGWLVRHRFIEDPDNWEIKQRMAKAREGGWDVPEWMDNVVIKGASS